MSGFGNSLTLGAGKSFPKKVEYLLLSRDCGLGLGGGQYSRKDLYYRSVTDFLESFISSDQ